MKLEHEENLIIKEYSKHIGKTVYFMCENKVVKGKVTSVDKYQLFIQFKNPKHGYSILQTKEFFYELEDLFAYLKNNFITGEQ